MTSTVAGTIGCQGPQAWPSAWNRTSVTGRLPGVVPTVAATVNERVRLGATLRVATSGGPNIDLRSSQYPGTPRS